MPRIRCFGPLLLAVSLASAAQTAPATRPQPGATIDPAIADPTGPMEPPAFVPGQTATSSRRPVRISGGVMAGYVRSRVDPVYPADARSAHLSGAVVMDALIGKTGAVETLTVVSGPPVLAAAAMEAVRQWLYKPILVNGQPTEVRTTVTVNFNLNPGLPPQ